MVLNELGLIVNSEWINTPAIRPDMNYMNLELGEFITMPNHFHGIIIIGENEFNMVGGHRDAMHRVSTNTIPTNQFGPQSKNLGSIMRGFKSAITTTSKKLNIEFGWQDRFHDHPRP